VRLEPPGTSFVHGGTQRSQVSAGQVVACKCALVQEFRQTLGDTVVDDLTHPGLDLWLLAVPDRFDQQLTKRGLCECRA
jgi:hypothetical protein